MNTLSNLAELSALTQGSNPLEQLAGIMQLLGGLQGLNMGQAENARADRRLSMDESNQTFQRDLASRADLRADRGEARADRQLTLAQLGQEDERAFRQGTLRNQERGLMAEGRRNDLMENNIARQADQGQSMTLLGMLEQLSRMPGASPTLMQGIFDTTLNHLGIELPTPPPNPQSDYINRNIPGFSAGQPTPLGY
jgi:hypothetical protein